MNLLINISSKNSSLNTTIPWLLPTKVISFVHIEKLLVRTFYKGVKTCQLMDYIVDQVERSQNTLDAFTRVVVRDSDLGTTIVYFAAKVEHDPGLYFKYTFDDEN